MIYYKMSNKIPPRVQFNYSMESEEEEEKEISESVDFDVDDFDSYEEEQKINGFKNLEVVEKPKPVKEDIFDLPNLAVMPDEVKEELMEQGIKPMVKEKKKRKPMSEEHKAKLGLAREKAMIARKANAEERKKMKELDNQEKELLKQQKVKKVQKLKKEVEEPEPEPQQVIQKVSNSITRKDLEEAQYDAIVKYETLRKQRKAEKKKVQEQDRQKQELMNKLKPQQSGYKARDASGRLLNRWDMCY
jgi:hypothetical protein